jgi:pyruvate-formate lyase
VDLTKASHGSVLDLALHNSLFADPESLDKLAALIRTFLVLPCTATLQPNVLDRETLLKARANPRDPQYRTLVVRVWGFSAVFVDLVPDLQEHVLARTEHGLGA